MTDPLARYSRQMILPGWGRDGQERLAGRTAAVIGCGALGSHIAAHLVRIGVGHVILADRDFVEWHNLPRQALYTEQDAAEGIPKAVAAARRLRQINSLAQVEERVVDVDADSVEELICQADVVFDGADNFEVRYLVNEACVKHRYPLGLRGRAWHLRSVCGHRTRRDTLPALSPRPHAGAWLCADV